MSISSNITRIINARNKIRDKLVALGLAKSTDTIDTLATAVDGIEVAELDKPTITVIGSTVTARVSANNGGYLSADATASNAKLISDLLPSKAKTNYMPGTEPNVIEAGTYLSGDQTILGDSDLIPENIKSGIDIFGVIGTFTGGDGYTLQSKTVEPMADPQEIAPDAGYYGLSKVIVDPIPSNYVNIDGASKFYGSIDGLNRTSIDIPAGYYTGGMVSLTSDIETALSEI